MFKGKYFVKSHSPFLHNGSCITVKNYETMIAAMPAVLGGLCLFGAKALGVICLSVSLSIFWEVLFNRLIRREDSVGDGNAALIGLLFGMMMPATVPWWLIATGTFVAIFIGKMIYGGLGCNPFNPVLVAVAMITLSWSKLIDFNAVLVDYNFNFEAMFPLTAAKYFPDRLGDYTVWQMFLGCQTGGIGTTFGLGLLIGGIWLLARGHIRWEILVSFLVALIIAATIFKVSSPERYASPFFHLVTGYALLGAFFLAPEDSSSPVNKIPMILYGALAGILIILIRNIGAHEDGTVFAILLMNAANPLLDKIRPKALKLRRIENA